MRPSSVAAIGSSSGTDAVTLWPLRVRTVRSPSMDTEHPPAVELRLEGPRARGAATGPLEASIGENEGTTPSSCSTSSCGEVSTRAIPSQAVVPGEARAEALPPGGGALTVR